MDEERPAEPERINATNEAIRAAAKVAIDAGDIATATALLGMLGNREVKPGSVPAGVIDLGARRRGTR